MDLVLNYNSLINNQVKLKFIFLFKKFITAAKKGEVLTNKGNIYSKKTLRIYNQTLGYLQKYEDRSGIIYLDDITPHWADMFRIYLTENNLSKNTIFGHMVRIKAVLNRACKAGLTLHNGFGINTPKDKAYTVFNTIEELKRMYALDLPLGKARVRDIYIINCFLGMRWDDLKEFAQNPKKYIKEINGNSYVHYELKKTENYAIIPIGYVVKEILKKWNYDFGEPFTNSYYNKTIKMIAKQAGITEINNFKKTQGGKRVEITKKKWEMMSSHTARRTFISQCVLFDIPAQQIMKFSGHSSEESFQCYVRITALQNAINLSNHEIFKVKL